MKIRFGDPFPPREGEDDKDKKDPLKGVAEEVRTAVKNLSERHGSLEKALATVLDENFRYRTERRDMQTEIDDLKKKVPKDGAMSISKAEHELFEDYKKLGALAPVKKMVEEHPNLTKQLEDRAADDQRRVAARLMGWNPDVLADLGRAKGFTVEVKDVKVKEGDETKMVPTAYVTVAGKKEAVELKEYAELELKPYLPSLTAGVEDQGEHEEGRQPFPKTPANQPPKGSANKAIEALEKRRKARSEGAGNPLQQKAASK